MKKRIGIFASRLQHCRPRGVHRVARGVAEYLAAHADPNEFELLCLAKRVKNEHEITFKAYDLAHWLSRHPLAAAAPSLRPRPSQSWLAGLRRSCKKGVKLALSPFVPHLLRPLCYLGYRLLLTALVGWIGPVRRGLAYLRAQRLTARRKRQLDPGHVAVTLNELDLLISFENHEEIWRLPVENYPCKTIGWFYDVISLRVDDEARWNLDHLEKDLSSLTLKADRIVCGSQSAEQDLHTFYPRSSDKTCVIYDGHDMERFRSAGDGAIEPGLMELLGINRDVPYLIAVGGIEARKNNINMLRACIHLRKLRPALQFQLVLVGEVYALPGFRLQVERARRFLPVIHTGYVGDNVVATLMAGARGLLYPSLWEGFGIPPLEAMSAGTVVIASDLGSIPEVCGEHAIYCDPYEPADIAESIARCLDMPSDERAYWTERARRHAARFSWERMGEQVVQLVRAELAGSDEMTNHPSSLEIGDEVVGAYPRPSPRREEGELLVGS